MYLNMFSSEELFGETSSYFSGRSGCQIIFWEVLFASGPTIASCSWRSKSDICTGDAPAYLLSLCTSSRYQSLIHKMAQRTHFGRVQ